MLILVIFMQKNFHKKPLYFGKIGLHCELRQVYAGKLCNARCFRDNANVNTYYSVKLGENYKNNKVLTRETDVRLNLTA